MTHAVLSERRGPVLDIVLDRPDNLNAINPELVAGIIDGLELAATDHGVRVVALRGNGRGFCAGGDLKLFAEWLDAGHGIDSALPDELHRMVALIRTLRKPVVAIVHGPCAGAGMSLALACDVVVAADDAFFNLAYSAIGLSPDGSSTYFLPRHLGLKRAVDLFFNPRRLSAREALDLGLITEVVPADELLARGREVCDRLAAGPTRAYGAVKALLLTTFVNDLHSQLALETRYIVDTSQSADFARGLRAFLDKRAPAFQGD